MVGQKREEQSHLERNRLFYNKKIIYFSYSLSNNGNEFTKK
jgi:hypothetical protein